MHCDLHRLSSRDRYAVFIDKLQQAIHAVRYLCQRWMGSFVLTKYEYEKHALYIFIKTKYGGITMATYCISLTIEVGWFLQDCSQYHDQFLVIGLILPVLYSNNPLVLKWNLACKNRFHYTVRDLIVVNMHSCKLNTNTLVLCASRGIVSVWCVISRQHEFYFSTTLI